MKLLALKFSIIFFTINNISAQSYTLHLSSNPLNYKIIQNADSLFHTYQLRKIENHYKANGYATFSIDSVSWNYKLKKAEAYIFYGIQYKIGAITILPDTILKNERNNLLSRYSLSVLDTSSFQKMAEAILVYMENNGYPFSTVTPQLLKIKDKQVNVNLSIDKGALFLFDTMQIEGDAKVKKKFLEAYTGLKSNKPYSEEVFSKAYKKLNQLPFLQAYKQPLMVFVHGGIARPYLYLRKKKSDQVNGIIGLAPGNTSSTQSTKTVLTGEFMIRLNNLFKSGKQFFVNWRSFQARSQELKTGFNYPYLLGQPIGIDLGFELLKYDTLYTTTFRQIGFQYYTSGINGFKVFYNINSTNLNTVDTLMVKNTKEFPNINAVSIKQYGLSASFNLLDYRFNPRKGWLIESTVSTGSKQILKDNKIEAIKFGNAPNTYTLYDSTTLKTNQYRIRIKMDKYFAIGNKSTFKIGTDIDHIIAPRIYFNEVLRLGGIYSLKGFNEQSIFATNFNMLDIEYRYLLSANSYIKAFWNGAYYEDKSFGRTKSSDTPWGLGLGANLETRAGILSIIYALGKEKKNNFDLRTGKIHFGISSYF